MPDILTPRPTSPLHVAYPQQGDQTGDFTKKDTTT